MPELCGISCSLPVGAVWAGGRDWGRLGLACLELASGLCLSVRGLESWESSFPPESCVGHSLAWDPNNPLSLTLLLTLVDTLEPGDRLFMVH